MRLMVMFDLPVETKPQQTQYRKFRKNLIDNGFMMLQYSVYVRYCTNDTAVDKFINRISKLAPKDGDVRFIRITEKQFENMVILVGSKSAREELEKKDNLIIID